MKKYILFSAFTLLAVTQLAAQAFITTWKTDNPGTSNSTQITIPTTGGGYNYNIYWEEVGNANHNGNANNVAGDHTIDFGTAGTYRIEITGTFPRIFFNNEGDKSKLLTVEQWGNITWTSMASAFRGCNNLTIPAVDAPDLSNVTSMSSMFSRASAFNQSINHWNVSNVINMSIMFSSATAFNQPLNSWDVSNVTNMRGMFHGTDAFNQPLNSWDVSNVTDMSLMFSDADAFNQPINSWNVSSVTNMNSMFGYADNFNQPIGNWDVSNVTNMGSMFNQAANFNQPIGSWDVSKVATMDAMFSGASNFNQPIGNWNVSSVINMAVMFQHVVNFNQPLDSWNVSSVTDMRYMFYNASIFNQSIDAWNVGNVTNMSLMFAGARAFNQPLANWNVSNVTNMESMFYSATSFDQSLGSWNISKVTEMTSMLDASGLSSTNYGLTLEGWGAQSVNPGITLGAGNLQYCSGGAARNKLITIYDWTIVGDRGCSQTITFPSIPTKTYGDLSFDLTATATSGLSVSYSSSNTNVADFLGNTLIIMGAGTCTITATQTGDYTYVAANPVQQTFIVNKANQTITFTALADKLIGDAPFTVSATSNTSLPISLSAVTTNITVNGNTVTIIGAGKATIRATQAGNSNYVAATPIEQTFCINPLKPILGVSGLGTGTTILTSSVQNGNQWYKNGTAISNAVNNTHIVAQPGIYTATVAVEGCVSEPSDPLALIVTEVEQPGSSAVSVYPNPVHDVLTVDVPASSGVTEVTLYDFSGRAAAGAMGTQQIALNVQALAQGMYIVRIKNEKQVITQLINKQ